MYDLMPNSGERFILDVPESRKTKESSERIKAKKDFSVLETLLSGIDERIQRAESIFELNMNPETSEESIRVQLIAARWRVRDLQDIRAWVESQITTAREVQSEQDN